MSFVSAPFVLFLACLFLLYYLIPKRGQWILLLVGSYVFYAFAGLQYLVFLLYTTLVAYLIALALSRHRNREDLYVEGMREKLSKEERKAYRKQGKHARRAILTIGLVLGFGLLAVFKYTGFFVGNLNMWFHLSIPVPSLLFPLGLSFYVFQTMGYLIDVYRGKGNAETNPFRLALFVSFFPQLVQGPISRYGDLAKQLYAEHSPMWENLSGGFVRILYGYFKKLVVADTALIGVKTLIGKSADWSGGYVAVLILLYSVEIYADFTGGLDITIGIAEMLGIRLAENFNRPFSSKSTKEYWRRWHITMGTWFTDYVFYPLSVSGPMQKFSKWSRAHLGQAVGKRLPVYLATIVTWFLTGLWHGAGWNFIVWGLLNCAVILISEELEPLYRKFREKFPRLSASGFWGAFCAIRTFLLMGLIRSLDCYRDVPRTFAMWGTLLTGGEGWRSLFAGGLLSFGLGIREYCILGAGILVMYVVSLLGRKKPLRARLTAHPVLLCAVCVGLGLIVLLFGSYGIGYDASGFIYTQY